MSVFRSGGLFFSLMIVLFSLSQAYADLPGSMHANHVGHNHADMVYLENSTSIVGEIVGELSGVDTSKTVCADLCCKLCSLHFSEWDYHSISLLTFSVSNLELLPVDVVLSAIPAIEERPPRPF